MRLHVAQRAMPGAVFAPDAFAAQVGRSVPLRDEDGATTGQVATIVSAEVVDEGRTVALVLEVPDGASIDGVDPTADLSVGFAVRPPGVPPGVDARWHDEFPDDPPRM